MTKAIKHCLWRMFCYVHRLAANPSLNLMSGLVLLFCGLAESVAGLGGDEFDSYIRAHHGVAFFGFIEMIKALPDVMRGLRFVEDGEGVFRIGDKDPSVA